jgi:hypothetical protein
MNHTYNLKYAILSLGFKLIIGREGVYKYTDELGITYIAYWGSYLTNSGQHESICINNSITKEMSKTVSAKKDVEPLFEYVKAKAQREKSLKEVLE